MLRKVLLKPEAEVERSSAEEQSLQDSLKN
jgi:hypothetical protein